MFLKNTQIELAIETLTEYIEILNIHDCDKEEIKKIKKLRDNLTEKSSQEIAKILNGYNNKIKKYNINGDLEV